MKQKALGRKRRACLSQPSFYLCLGGLNAILLAIGDTVIRLDLAVTDNPNLIGSLYIPAIEYIAASMLVLLGGVLLLEYVQKQNT